MKCTKIDLPMDLDAMEIEIFSDLHIGSSKCDYKSINNRIEKVKNNSNTFCIILGDIINNSTKTSVGDVYSEALSPMGQVDKSVKIFQPIKDKIIGVVAGNHERRTYKQDGIDLVRLMCRELGIEDKYSSNTNLLFIRLGKDPRNTEKAKRQIAYTLYMAHGDGANGHTKGAKVNATEKRSKIVNADIIVTGHTHEPYAFHRTSYNINWQNSTFLEFDQLCVGASATLDYEDYADIYGMEPSCKKSPIIYLSGTRKQADAKI